MANIVDRDDIRMVQAAGSLGLTLEPLDDLVMVRRFAPHGNGLQRDRTPNHAIMGLVYHAHGAASQLREDFIPAIEDDLRLACGLRVGSRVLVGRTRYLQRTHFRPFYECFPI